MNYDEILSSRLFEAVRNAVIDLDEPQCAKVAASFGLECLDYRYCYECQCEMAAQLAGLAAVDIEGGVFDGR